MNILEGVEKYVKAEDLIKHCDISLLFEKRPDIAIFLMKHFSGQINVPSLKSIEAVRRYAVKQCLNSGESKKKQVRYLQQEFGITERTAYQYLLRYS